MGDCHYCRRKLSSPKDKGPLGETRDHLHPKSRGGTDTVPCCRQCNRMKADMSLAAWKIFMTNNPNWWVTDTVISNDETVALRAELDAERERAGELDRAWTATNMELTKALAKVAKLRKVLVKARYEVAIYERDAIEAVLDETE